MDNSGPAFPTKKTIKEAAIQSGKAPYEVFYDGLSLRDYFAGQALMGLCAYYGGTDTAKYLGERSFSYADAMLKAREAK